MVFEAYSHTYMRGRAPVWVPVLAPGQLRRVGTLESGFAQAKRAQNGYVDTHCWVFTARSFVGLLEDLHRLGLLRFRVRHFEVPPPAFAEFHVLLEKCEDAAAIANSLAQARAIAQGDSDSGLAGPASEKRERRNQPMLAEIPEDTVEIDKVVSRLKTVPGIRRSLPELSVLQQSGPFKSVNQFFASSFDYFRHLLYYTSITPSSRVMDFGCGLGRMAIPFSAFLESERGFYCGLDTDGTVIERDKAMFAGRKNVEFRHVDIFNKHYNPVGKPATEVLAAQRFEAPFDLAFLFSVFTHILPDDLDAVIGFLAANLGSKGEISRPGS